MIDVDVCLCEWGLVADPDGLELEAADGNGGDGGGEQEDHKEDGNLNEVLFRF